MRIRVDPVAVASMGVSLEDVRAAISNANSMSPLGTFRGRAILATHYPAPTTAPPPSADYQNIVVKSANAPWCGSAACQGRAGSCATAARRPGSTPSPLCCW
jgi:multidrug efflux pump subunit AcrB